MKGETSSDPLVDVGIPAYGRPAYLTEAIESVLGQTETRWRLFVSEDGPGSQSVREAMQPYLHDPRIRYSARGETLGPARNKNVLLEDLTAPYVAVLDDDDRWHPGFLARRMQFLEQHPECGFVFSGCREVNSEGRKIGQYEPFDSEGVKSIPAVWAALLQENVVRTPTILVRREAYEAVGAQFDSRFDFTYDWEMWLRLALRFPAGYLLGEDVEYRFHNDQVTRGVRFGVEQLALAEHADAMRHAASLELAVDTRKVDQARSNWSISATLDSIEVGAHRQALGYLVHAVRLHPRSLFDRRVPAALLGLVLGRRAGRFVVTRLHENARRQRWQAMRAQGEGDRHSRESPHSFVEDL